MYGVAARRCSVTACRNSLLLHLGSVTEEFEQSVFSELKTCLVTYLNV